MPNFGHNRKTQRRQGWNVAESTTRSANDNQERVDLDPAAFERLLDQKGTFVKVFRSMYCPNVKSVDGAEHNIDCTMCQGSGFIDVDPIEVKAFIQNQELETLANVEGFVQGNSVAITFPIGVEIQYFTKVELADKSDIYYQRVLRTPGSQIDVLKYAAKRINVLIENGGTRYYQDQDFRISPDGNVDWSISARTPADNAIYTIHYETSIQYRAVTALHANRFTQVQRSKDTAEHIKMQEQWMCVKEFLVRREDSLGQETPQGPYDNHSIVTDNS